MSSPYGLPVINSCEDCPLRKSSFFCSFSAETLRELNACSHLSTYPQRAMLATQGQAPQGVFILCSGRIKLSSISREGKSVILRIVRPGEVVGLSAVMSGTRYDAAAETLSPCLVRFVGAADLLRLARNHVEVGLHIATALSKECVSAYDDIRSLTLAPSCSNRLAGLLLSWCPRPKEGTRQSEMRINSSFTHEEIAAMIGTTRETVSRLFGDFKKNQVIESKGCTLTVRNLAALREMAAI